MGTALDTTADIPETKRDKLQDVIAELKEIEPSDDEFESILSSPDVLLSAASSIQDLTLDTINEVIEETTIELDRKPSVLEVKSEKVEEELVLKPSNIIVKSLELDSPEIKESPKKLIGVLIRRRKNLRKMISNPKKLKLKL